MKISKSKVKKITSAGTQRTFDIEMPTVHNFIANDIVSHNSHASSYGLIAYHAQWLKTNYPLEFWTTSLNHGDEIEDVPRFISEIKETLKEIKGSKEIIIGTADINKSTNRFECDPKENEIFWSLTKIKGVGDKAVLKIIEHRNEVGEFKSLMHFLEVVPKKDCNKKVVTNMIVSGAFDKLEGLKYPNERLLLLFSFYEKMGHNYEKCPYMDSPINEKDFFWTFEQKALTGFGEINFARLVRESDLRRSVKSEYVQEDDLKRKVGNAKKKFEPVTVCGIYDGFVEFGKKKDKHIKIFINANSVKIECLIWHSNIDKYKLPEKNEIIVVDGDLDLINKNRNTVILKDRSKIVKL